VRVGDNVQAEVYVALQNALEKGDDLPVVPRSRPVRLRSYVRFVDEENRRLDTTFSYLWEDADQVRLLRKPCLSASDGMELPDDLALLRRSHGVRQALNLSDPTVSRSGPASLNLILEPNALAAGQVYTFRLKVTTHSPAGNGQAEISFRVNRVRLDLTPARTWMEYLWHTKGFSYVHLSLRIEPPAATRRCRRDQSVRRSGVWHQCHSDGDRL